MHRLAGPPPVASPGLSGRRKPADPALRRALRPDQDRLVADRSHLIDRHGVRSRAALLHGRGAPGGSSVEHAQVARDTGLRRRRPGQVHFGFPAPQQARHGIGHLGALPEDRQSAAAVPENELGGSLLGQARPHRPRHQSRRRSRDKSPRHPWCQSWPQHQIRSLSSALAITLLPPNRC